VVSFGKVASPPSLPSFPGGRPPLDRMLFLYRQGLRLKSPFYHLSFVETKFSVPHISVRKQLFSLSFLPVVPGLWQLAMVSPPCYFMRFFFSEFEGQAFFFRCLSWLFLPRLLFFFSSLFPMSVFRRFLCCQVGDKERLFLVATHSSFCFFFPDCGGQSLPHFIFLNFFSFCSKEPALYFSHIGRN